MNTLMESILIDSSIREPDSMTQFATILADTFAWWDGGAPISI